MLLLSSKPFPFTVSSSFKSILFLSYYPSTFILTFTFHLILLLSSYPYLFILIQSFSIHLISFILNFSLSFHRILLLSFLLFLSSYPFSILYPYFPILLIESEYSLLLFSSNIPPSNPSSHPQTDSDFKLHLV